MGSDISEISDTGVRLDGGEFIAADLVVLTTGLEAAPFAGKLPAQRDELGRVVVDGQLRPPGLEHIFVAGDAASADVGDGHRTLQSCQHALRTGRFAGENAARLLLGLPLICYEQRRYVTCLDLGRAGAVFTEGWAREVTMSGSEAKAVKERINREVIYPSGSGDALLASAAPLG
jgi:NADH dehydrogenase